MSRRWLRGHCATQGKIRCRDQSAAEQFARHVVRVSEGHSARDGMPYVAVPMFTYQCKSCRYWHITRRRTFLDNGVRRLNAPVPMETPWTSNP